MHRHEFSAPIEPQYLQRKSGLTRSALSNTLTRRASTYDRPSPTLNRPTLSRPHSEYTSLPRITDLVVHFHESETERMSEDGNSIANSEDSETTTVGGRRRRREPRTSTAFHFAHPAPTLTQKQRLLQIRPKLLLQLQMLSAETRPKPVLDVLPSAVFVPRLVKTCPRMFRGKDKLGLYDVMVVKSEEYDSPDDSIVDETDSDEEGLASRDLIAVLCQMRKDASGVVGKAEIVLKDGSVWISTPLPNGSYEFISTDEYGNTTKARWVKRMVQRSTSDSTSTNEFKFAFSIIDPNTRRHPIMASLTHNTLDIPDFYTTVSPSSGSHPPTSPIRVSLPEQGAQTPAVKVANERTAQIIDDDLKMLIQVTGVWVALRQGVSPYFKYNDAASSRITSGGRSRSLSLTPDQSPISPESTSNPFGSGVGGRFRRSYTKASPTVSVLPQFDQASLPKRAVSTGATFMQRAAARKAGNTPSTVTSETEMSVLQDVHLSSNLLSHNFTPPSLILPGSSLTTPDTPSRTKKRPQSAYIPSDTPPYGDMSKASGNRNSYIRKGKRASDYGEKSKIGRWKTFTNLFRRSRGNINDD
jgi:hypothetical protein